MLRKTVLVIAVLVIVLSGARALADLNYLWFNRDFTIYVDPKTGVNYIVREEYGSFGNSIAMSVRYNSDGSLVVSNTYQ
jgi:hypothetical protein